MNEKLDEKHFSRDAEIRVKFTEIQNLISMSKGWTVQNWNGKPTFKGSFGGNEIRFRIENTPEIKIVLTTEPYVWIHIFLDEKHIQAVAPESSPAIVTLPIDKQNGNDVRIIRSTVSSGPFYVDVYLLEIIMNSDGVIKLPKKPVPSTVFCTFGDSISGNSLIGPDQPFDPYNVGYGWLVCNHFGWQYFNTARDGSGLCRRLFENPLAQERVENEVIAYIPDYLFMFYGTNDLAGGADLYKEFAPAYEKLLTTLKTKLPKTRITCSALLWRSDFSEEQIRTFSKIILETCDKFQIQCCDPFDWLKSEYFRDGLHPNEQGHKKIAEKLIHFFKNLYPE